MSSFDSIQPPHRWVADQLDMSVAGVSLLRSGKRKPSRETMEVIERVFGWSVADQFVRDWDNYTDELNRRLNLAYTAKAREMREQGK